MSIILRKGRYKCSDCGHKTFRREGSATSCFSCGAPTAKFVKLARSPHMHRRTSIRATTPVVRHLIELIDAAGLTRMDLWHEVGVATNGLSVWRTGKGEPSLRSMEAVAEYLGYELKLVKKESNDDNQD